MLLELFTEPPTNGKVIDSSDEHPENAELPMLVTRSGIVIDSSDEQPLNAELPILVTLLGIVIDSSDEQL